MNDSILLLGLGNEYRSDDGLGIYAAREIRRRKIPGVAVAELAGEGTSLMQAWSHRSRVILVDAISSGATAGEIYRLDVATDPIPPHYFHYSSHAFGVAEAVELARILHRTPDVLLLFGIEGKQFDAGLGLTDVVLRSMPDLLALIECDLRRLAQRRAVPNTPGDSAVV
jgi:hydrogenase maturation protease